MSIITSLKTLTNSATTWFLFHSPLIFHRVTINSRLICSSCSIEHPLEPSVSLDSKSAAKTSLKMNSFCEDDWVELPSTGESLSRLAIPVGLECFVGEGRRGALNCGTGGFGVWLVEVVD